MLKKINRLTTKDINFIFKKQKIVHSKDFTFMFFLQYPNRQYNQFSFQISLKFHKKATKRVMVKRIVYDYILEQGFIGYKFGNNYYKIFIVTNKATNEKLKKLVETNDKKFIKLHIRQMLQVAFRDLTNKLGKK